MELQVQRKVQKITTKGNELSAPPSPVFGMDTSNVIQILHVSSEIFYWHLKLSMSEMQCLTSHPITVWSRVYIVIFHDSTNLSKLNIITDVENFHSCLVKIYYFTSLCLSNSLTCFPFVHPYLRSYLDILHTQEIIFFWLLAHFTCMHPKAWVWSGHVTKSI